MADKEKNQLMLMLTGLLASTPELHSPEKIRSTVSQMLPALAKALPNTPTVSDQEVEDIARHFEAIHGVSMNIGGVLQDHEFRPWLEAARSEMDMFYWNRYQQYLAHMDFSGQVIATLGDVTDRTLGLLENPKQTGTWDRRGLVMGHVQSGKTANYIGLLCKAADAGYKVFIVIAGIHNNLRNQTQTRIDEGLIGFDSAKMSVGNSGPIPIGVGRFDPTRRPNTFTTSIRDFNKATATSVGIPLTNILEPVVFVIKKNANTLRHLIDWLKEYNHLKGVKAIPEPMILIDDEADNASINIRRSSDDVSRINGLIRNLLELFERSCYVGYTATPFANIFIDPETDNEMYGQDLFPRDFIVSLDPPDNYFGPASLFLDNGDDCVRMIDDHESELPLSHRMDHLLTGLPETLKDAVNAFILVRAIRIARGHTNVHNSMLVNASRFLGVQRQIRNEIHQYLDQVRNSINIGFRHRQDTALDDPDLRRLYQVFCREYSSRCSVSWLDIQEYLWESVSAIGVVEVNMRSSQSLDYSQYSSTGLNVIAVGGYSLSRGLTLQGLSISYFLRNSIMYDTLMQMGRWFGYRSGYQDLCRIWMLDETVGWYAHIADSIEELHEDVRRMEGVRATPLQFGLKVRSHPDSLIVTARNKMGSGKRIVASIGLGNQFIETATLLRDRESLDANRRSAVELCTNLRGVGLAPEEGVETPGMGRFVRGVPCWIVTNFLKSFRNHYESVQTLTDPVRRYIDVRAADELKEWDVLFVGAHADKKSVRDSSLGFELLCQRRTEGIRSDERTLLITNKQRVASRGAERFGLSEREIAKAEKDYRSAKNIDPSTSRRINYPDRIFRRFRTKPLLMIHLLTILKGGKLSVRKPVVAWSISFPRTKREEERVEWVVNETWLQERYGSEDEDEAGEDHD